jgi:NADPH:quinone reductase-like Zn-dependent oxidoreductase
LKLPRGFGTIGRIVLGLSRPRQPILGTEFSGVVEALGHEVTGFKAGDAIIGFADAKMRCHAEYRTMPANGSLALMPANLSFEEAGSLMFGATTALHFLRKARLAADERVLVLGASGAVGSAMVQLARHRGAHVTGVTSTGNLDLVRSLCAHEVIDYTKQDDIARSDVALGTRYDVIADTVGASSFAACKAMLQEHGRYLAIAGTLSDLLARPSGTKISIGGPASGLPEDVLHLANLAEIGVLKPVIDSIYPFESLPKAHARVETGRKRGSVVVTVSTP